MIRDFLFEEDGLGTVEVLLILAGLVSIAIIFKNQLLGFIRTSGKSVFGGATGGAAIDTKD